MKIFLLLIACAAIWITIRKVEVRVRKKSKIQKEKKEETNWKQDILMELKALKKYEVDAYEGESALFLQSYLDKINTCMELVFKENMTDALKDEIHAMKREIDNDITKWKNAPQSIVQALDEMEQTKEKIASYLAETNFYPADFAIDNNKLSGMIVEINENKGANPLMNLEPSTTFATELYKKVQLFQEQHQQVVSVIEKIEAQQQDYPANKRNRILDIKNELFIALHQGNFEKTKKILHDLRALIK